MFSPVADNACLRDERIALQPRLEVGRRNVLSAREHNYLFFAIRDLSGSFGIYLRNVARIQPTGCVDHLARLGFALSIALHHVMSAHEMSPIVGRPALDALERV